MNFDNLTSSGGLKRASERKDKCMDKLKEEVKKKRSDWVEEVVEAAGAKPGEAFLLAPRAESSSADTLEVYTGRRLLGSKSGVGGLGHSSVFLKLPSRPLANSQVSAGIFDFHSSSWILPTILSDHSRPIRPWPQL